MKAWDIHHQGPKSQIRLGRGLLLSTEILTNASRIATICVVLQDDFGNYDGGDFGPEGDGLYGQVKYDEIPNTAVSPGL